MCQTLTIATSAHKKKKFRPNKREYGQKKHRQLFQNHRKTQLCRIVAACFRWTMKHGKLCKMSNWRFFSNKHNVKNTLNLNFACGTLHRPITSKKLYLSWFSGEKTCISTYFCSFSTSSDKYAQKSTQRCCIHIAFVQLHQNSISMGDGKKKMCCELDSICFGNVMSFGQILTSIYKVDSSLILFLVKAIVRVTYLASSDDVSQPDLFTFYWEKKKVLNYRNNGPLDMRKIENIMAVTMTRSLSLKCSQQLKKEVFFLTYVKCLEIAYFCIPKLNHNQKSCKVLFKRIHRTQFMDESSIQRNVEKKNGCVLCIGVSWIEILLSMRFSSQVSSQSNLISVNFNCILNWLT